ncbi:MAG: OmpW family outer membrane protein [Thermoanaerobaculia bacterium]
MALFVLLASLGSPAWGQTDYTDIYVLGNPATTIARHHATDEGELSDLLTLHEFELREAITVSGWQGNADDLFVAIRSAKPGDGTITRHTVQPGESFQWMTYRKAGKPAVLRNPRWSAKEPMKAWQIKFVSDGQEYGFLIPEICLNLAYIGSRPMGTQSCSISGTYDADSDLITLTGRTDGTDLSITGVQTPSGAGDLGAVKSVGANKWTFPATAGGRYSFEAEAKSTIGTKDPTCSTTVQATPKVAACNIDATLDPETKVITVTTAGSLGDVSVTGVTMPDGTAGAADLIHTAGTGRYTVDVAKLPKKVGTHTYTINAVSSYRGTESSCQTTVAYTRVAPPYKWIVRGFPGYWSPANDDSFVQVDRANGVNERTDFMMDSGWGFGINGEYLVMPALGIVLGLDWVNFDSSLMVDLDDAWETDKEDVAMRLWSLGLNYHFTPDKRFDLFAGAFVGLAQFDTVNYNALGETWKLDFDDDTAYGLNVGVDFPFSVDSPWIFTAGVRYMWSDVSSKGDVHEINLNPWALTAGVGYRF